jgi:hypothetical protein
VGDRSLLFVSSDWNVLNGYSFTGAMDILTADPTAHAQLAMWRQASSLAEVQEAVHSLKSDGITIPSLLDMWLPSMYEVGGCLLNLVGVLQQGSTLGLWDLLQKCRIRLSHHR